MTHRTARRLSAAAVALFAAAVSAPAAAPDARPIAIVHGRVLSGTGDAPIENGTVVLRGRTIEYAGPAGGGRIPADARVIEIAAGSSRSTPAVTPCALLCIRTRLARQRHTRRQRRMVATCTPATMSGRNS